LSLETAVNYLMCGREERGISLYRLFVMIFSLLYMPMWPLYTSENKISRFIL